MAGQQPALGRIVHYTSRNGDGVVSPAVVLRTRDTTIPEVIERWEQSISASPKPADLAPELPDAYTVDLLVHGLGGDYREYTVEYDPAGAPRTWRWHDDAAFLQGGV